MSVELPSLTGQLLPGPSRGESHTPIRAAALTAPDEVTDTGRSARRADWPEPMREEAFRGVLGAATLAVAPETEADPAAIQAQALTMLGCALGRGPHCTIEGQSHHLNLFVCIVGRSAHGRKGVSLQHARRLFEHAEPEWLRRCSLSGLASGEGLIWAVRDPVIKSEPLREHARIVGYQDVVDDPGVPDKRLLVVETEFGSVLKCANRERNILSNVIRCAWDGADLQCSTKTNAAKASEPHIAIIGHITEAELSREMASSERHNGFANRFLWICAKRTRLLPEGGRPVDLQRHVVGLRRVIAFARDVGEMAFDAAARQVVRDEYERLTMDRPGAHNPLTSRAAPIVRRLACLYALCDFKRTVSAEHVRAALAVWDYAEASAAYLFGAKQEDTLADRILRCLRGASVAQSRSDLLRALKVHAEELDGGLAVLARAGWLMNAAIQQVGGHARCGCRWGRGSGTTRVKKVKKVRRRRLRMLSSLLSPTRMAVRDGSSGPAHRCLRPAGTMRAMMRRNSDAWANREMRALLADLADRGVRVAVRGGLLHVAPASRATAEELACLKRHRGEAIILTLVCDLRTLDRLLAVRAGRLGGRAATGCCYLCGEELPPERSAGRCGWCALACRLHAGGPIAADLLALFPDEIRGRQIPSLNTLDFDLAVPDFEMATAS